MSEEIVGQLINSDKRSGRRFTIIMLVVVLPLSLASVLWSASLSHKLACQVELNVHIIAALRLRADTSAAERQAQRDFLTEWSDSQDPAERAQAQRSYLDVLDQVDAAHREHPLPDRNRC